MFYKAICNSLHYPNSMTTVDINQIKIIDFKIDQSLFS